jgi:hypothetical protein
MGHLAALDEWRRTSFFAVVNGCVDSSFIQKCDPDEQSRDLYQKHVDETEKWLLVAQPPPVDHGKTDAPGLGRLPAPLLFSYVCKDGPHKNCTAKGVFNLMVKECGDDNAKRSKWMEDAVKRGAITNPKPHAGQHVSLSFKGLNAKFPKNRAFTKIKYGQWGLTDHNALTLQNLRCDWAES